MRTIKVASLSALLCVLSAGVAQAATYSGTVTDKTTNKPAANDAVVLLDVQAGMAEVGHATTGANGHYTISGPGDGPYLIRVTHQGGTYFIAAPQNGGPGDIPVYDVAKKVSGVSIEADVLEIEAANGQLNVTERYFVHNTSNPPHTQYDPAHGFEIVLPPGAQFDGADARRPTGLPTSVQLKPAAGKDHFQFDFPIQPDEGDKDTVFQFQYHLPYNGSYDFKIEELLPADNVAILLPKSISFTQGSGGAFQSVPQDPSIQTQLMKNVPAGKTIAFTVSGTGSMPREAQGGQQAQQGGQAQPGGAPGGGIGEPINTPDPLTKYKWWILGGLALLLAAAAAFLLRRPAGVVAAAPGTGSVPATMPTPAFAAHTTSPAARSSALLNALKEELFALESEKIAGTISAQEYAEQKAALETVLKRALKRNA